MTWHVEIIKNVELVAEICVCRTDFTSKNITDVCTYLYITTKTANQAAIVYVNNCWYSDLYVFKTSNETS